VTAARHTRQTKPHRTANETRTSRDPGRWREVKEELAASAVDGRSPVRPAAARTAQQQGAGGGDDDACVLEALLHRLGAADAQAAVAQHRQLLDRLGRLDGLLPK